MNSLERFVLKSVMFSTLGALFALAFGGCSTQLTSVEDVARSPSSYGGKQVRLRDVPVSHYFWLPKLEKGAYEIGAEAKIWVVADRATPQLGDSVNLTGTVADNFSLGEYNLGTVILEKSRGLVYDYPGPTSQPIPTEPPAPPEIRRSVPQVNLFTSPGNNPQPEEVRISLGNEGPSDWSGSIDQPWLKVSPLTGNLDKGQDLVTFQADSAKFAAGEYDAVFTIRIGTAEREVAVRLYVTDRKAGDTINASVEQGTGTAWSAGMSLEGPIQVHAELLDRQLTSGIYGQNTLALVFYDRGDMSVVVEGTLANDSDTEWQVDFWPEAFDGEGRQVAWGLDRGGAPLFGHLQKNILPHSSIPITLHMTWADNISRIGINANKYPAWPPLP